MSDAPGPPAPETTAATASAPALPGPVPGELPAVPGYEVLGVLGRGGMGVVYKARQVKANRLVALKMILAGAHAGPDERARFLVEAEAAARLAHPNIVPLYEVGEHAGLPFFSLGLCEGGRLDQRLRQAPPTPTEAAALVEALARAVHYAHGKGVLHRDLKPANVLLDADGTPRIADFGLAKLLGGPGQTCSGAVLGTPSYMAPEQAAGRKDVGPAADVYGLGAVLYELLTGRPPFQGATFAETLAQALTDEPAPPARLRPGLAPDLEAVCLKCLRKAPAERYASAADLADDLRRFLDGEPVRARAPGCLRMAWLWLRRRRLPVALVALALLGVALAAPGRCAT
jgi:serine/threonine-protein kinase